MKQTFPVEFIQNDGVLALTVVANDRNTRLNQNRDSANDRT